MDVACNICGEVVNPMSILEHLRLLHPDQYGDGEVSDDLREVDAIVTARITIVRRITDDDVIDTIEATDGSGGNLPLTEALGMMRLGEDTLIRERMEGDDDE